MIIVIKARILGWGSVYKMILEGIELHGQIETPTFYLE